MVILGLLGLFRSLIAQSWTVPGAALQVLVERAHDSTWPADAGFVEVWPGGLDPARCRIEVFTTGGLRVPSRVLWAAGGQPFKVIFDTSRRASSYYVYLSEGRAQPSTWSPRAGLFWETRHFDKADVGDWEKAWAAFQAAGPVLGRSPVRQIFHGIHLHGPSEHFVGYFSGYFRAPRPGKYQFAVVSGEPAYLRIDGKLVVERSRKRRGLGRRGEFHGEIKLKAGLHRIEYLHFHGGGSFVAEAAWKPPGAKHYEVMPRDVFLPLAGFEVRRFEPGATGRPQGYFEWRMLEHNTAAEQSWVDVEFRVPGLPKEARVGWQFDDGTTASGARVRHLFVRTGMRRVQMVLQTSRGTLGLSEWVYVHPRWSQRRAWDDGRFARQKKELGKYDFSRLPPADLAALVLMAQTVNDRALLGLCGQWCLRRAREFRGPQGRAFYVLGNYYQDPEVRAYSTAERAWRLAVQISGAKSEFAAKARVRLAGLMVECFGKPEEALALLQAVSAELLTQDDQRLAKLIEGDAWLALGKLDRARQSYQAAGEVLRWSDPKQQARLMARLESARVQLSLGHLADAEEMLRRLAWESPRLRLSPELELALVRVHLARHEPQRAFHRSQSLLHVPMTDDQRAAVLFALIEASLALDQSEVARKALATLLEEHPYSEATARAKDRWGARLGSPAGVKPAETTKSSRLVQ